MLRRSMLFMPGNNPGMLQTAEVFGSDSIILDLEDAVSLGEKDAARILIKGALKTFNYFLLFTNASTLFISFPTIMIPSSTPIPGLANTCNAPQAIAIFVVTSADLLVSLQVPPT